MLPNALKGKKLISNSTRRNPAEQINETVPKKKDNLAMILLVFAPATANTMPINAHDIAMT